MEQFQQQIEIMDMLYIRLVAQCKKKCIFAPYKETELNKGESVCLDRCASKYFQLFETVSQSISQKGLESAQK